MKYADWAFKLRSYLAAVDKQYQEELTKTSIVDTETQRKLRERGKRIRHADVLHSGDDDCRSRVGQVSQCWRKRRVRGLEAVRDGMGAQASDEVCGTPDERAGVQTFQPSWQHSREPYTTTRTSPQRLWTTTSR